MTRLASLSARLVRLASLGLGLAPLGLSGCDVCISECVGDAAETDGDTTGGPGMTSAPGSADGGATDGGATGGAPGVSVGQADTECGPEDTFGETEETEGLGCGGLVPPPDVFDMRTVRAGDLVPPPAAYTADTLFLVLRSQGSVCGPDPLAPPDCGDPEEFTLVVVIPPEFQEVGGYDFGDFASETGFGEADLESWIHIGGTGCCETGVIPNTARLDIESIGADGSIIGQLCNFYWMPGLGQGLSGHVNAPAC